MSDHRALALAGAALLILTAAQPARAQDWRTVSSSRAMAGERALRVDVEYGAGQLKLGPAPRGTLYRSNIRYDAEAFRPKLDYADGRLRIGIEGGNVRGRNLRESLLDLKLSPDVPVDLHVAFGAADATIDLGGLRVQRAHIQTGASRTALDVTTANAQACEELQIEVGAARFEAVHLGNLNCERIALKGGVGEVVLDFTGDGSRNVSATIEMGLGALTLRVPRGLGVRVVKEGLLAGFDSEGLIKQGSSFRSQNWDTARRTLDLHIQAALGSIKVEWVDS